LNGNNFVSSESAVNGDINNSPLFINMPSDFSTSPTFTKRNVNKENGEKGKDFKKANKSKKSFIERPGDWICYNAKI